MINRRKRLNASGLLIGHKLFCTEVELLKIAKIICLILKTHLIIGRKTYFSMKNQEDFFKIDKISNCFLQKYSLNNFFGPILYFSFANI